MQSSPKTCYVGPRNHFKSTGIYAHFLWQVWRKRFNAMEEFDWATGSSTLEAHFFSYKQQSAAYHIGVGGDSMCQLIERNPWFDTLEDLKPTAETKGKWTWDGEHDISIEPHGMLSHTRGLHCDLVYVDDPYQDPENELKPTEILKINYIYKTVIAEIPTHEDDQIHIVTTPQTKEDFTFDSTLMEEFNHEVIPAIQDHSTEEVLWPEWMSYDDLMRKKREKGEKLFNQEFMCEPKSSEVGFFKEEDLSQIIQPGLQDVAEQTRLTGEHVAPGAVQAYVAGLDIGKKRHPSHLAVFGVTLDNTTEADDGGHRVARLIQVHSRWMDQWDYTRQVDYCQKVIDYFGISGLLYDDTRGEFESLKEMGRLPDEMSGVALSGKTKDKMATYLDTYASDNRVMLLPDDRQRRQILAVTNDLDAVESSDGHGESFYSVALAVMQAENVHWGSRVKSLEM